jgi:hypothetical protein
MEQAKAMLKTLGEVFVGACVAQVSAGQTDPKLIINAGIAAVAVVVGQYANPKNKAFGLTGK